MYPSSSSALVPHCSDSSSLSVSVSVGCSEDSEPSQHSPSIPHSPSPPPQPAASSCSAAAVLSASLPADADADAEADASLGVIGKDSNRFCPESDASAADELDCVSVPGTLDGEKSVVSSLSLSRDRDRFLCSHCGSSDVTGPRKSSGSEDKRPARPRWAVINGIRQRVCNPCGLRIARQSGSGKRRKAAEEITVTLATEVNKSDLGLAIAHQHQHQHQHQVQQRDDHESLGASLVLDDEPYNGQRSVVRSFQFASPNQSTHYNQSQSTLPDSNVSGRAVSSSVDSFDFSRFSRLVHRACHYEPALMHLYRCGCTLQLFQALTEAERRSWLGDDEASSSQLGSAQSNSSAPALQDAQADLYCYPIRTLPLQYSECPDDYPQSNYPQPLYPSHSAHYPSTAPATQCSTFPSSSACSCPPLLDGSSLTFSSYPPFPFTPLQSSHSLIQTPGQSVHTLSQAHSAEPPAVSFPAASASAAASAPVSYSLNIPPSSHPVSTRSLAVPYSGSVSHSHSASPAVPAGRLIAGPQQQLEQLISAQRDLTEKIQLLEAQIRNAAELASQPGPLDYSVQIDSPNNAARSHQIGQGHSGKRRRQESSIPNTPAKVYQRLEDSHAHASALYSSLVFPDSGVLPTSSASLPLSVSASAPPPTFPLSPDYGPSAPVDPLPSIDLSTSSTVSRPDSPNFSIASIQPAMSQHANSEAIDMQTESSASEHMQQQPNQEQEAEESRGRGALNTAVRDQSKRLDLSHHRNPSNSCPDPFSSLSSPQQRVRSVSKRDRVFSFDPSIVSHPHSQSQ